MIYKPIIIACNYGDELKASINDAILMYNLFIMFHKFYSWDIPDIYTDKLKSIEVSENMFSEHENIIIYFSGHGFNEGKIKICNTFYSCDELKNIIGKDKNIIFILECCHASSFYSNNSRFIYSCRGDELANESIIKINKGYQYPMILIDKTNKKHPISVFTYVFCVICRQNLNMWATLNNPSWQKIIKKYNQTVSFLD
jgi:hypothetical protein